MISENKTRVTLSLTKSTCEIIDYISSSSGLTKSQIIEAMLVNSIGNIPSLSDMIDYVVSFNENN